MLFDSFYFLELRVEFFEFDVDLSTVLLEIFQMVFSKFKIFFHLFIVVLIVFIFTYLIGIIVQAFLDVV